MGQVHEHALGFHPADHLIAQLRQPALVYASGSPREFVVEEVRRRHHAEAGVEQPVKVFHIPIQGVRTLDSENAGDHRRIAPAPLEVVGQVRRGAQEHELAAGYCRHALEPPGLVECPFCQLGPGARWPALGQRQPDDCVARSLVAFDIQPARCLGDDGESLHRNVPFDEPGNVGVPARAPLEQVPSPKERVCMEVSDQ